MPTVPLQPAARPANPRGAMPFAGTRVSFGRRTADDSGRVGDHRCDAAASRVSNRRSGQMYLLGWQPELESGYPTGAPERIRLCLPASCNRRSCAIGHVENHAVAGLSDEDDPLEILQRPYRGYAQG